MTALRDKKTIVHNQIHDICAMLSFHQTSSPTDSLLGCARIIRTLNSTEIDVHRGKCCVCDCTVLSLEQLGNVLAVVDKEKEKREGKLICSTRGTNQERIAKAFSAKSNETQKHTHNVETGISKHSCCFLWHYFCSHNVKPAVTASKAAHHSMCAVDFIWREQLW